MFAISFTLGKFWLLERSTLVCTLHGKNDMPYRSPFGLNLTPMRARIKPARLPSKVGLNSMLTTE